jgi:NTE family protein
MTGQSGKPKINLVFQGGGVKGAAYARVLDRFPFDAIAIKGVGGSSAGAIMAALVATGKPPSEIATILKSQELSSLLAKVDSERFERLTALAQKVRALFAKFSAGRKLRGAWHLWRLYSQEYESIFADFAHISSRKGCCSTKPLREWLTTFLQEETFTDVKLKRDVDLRIVAANLRTRKFGEFRVETHGGKSVVDAVVASASLPLFFEPVLESVTYHVDGGLLSNFPAFLFAHDDAPTVGFRLIEFGEPKDIVSFGDYLASLLLTMLEAHDARQELPQNFHPCDIPIHDIAATKFNLAPDDVKFLMGQGELAAKALDWTKLAKLSKPATYDPQPVAALDLALTEARKILPVLSRPGVWPDKLEQQLDLSVWITPEFDGIYEGRLTLHTEGPRPLIALPFGHVPSDEFMSKLLQESIGLRDLEFSIAEIVNGKEQKLTGLPTENRPTRKEFLVFFSPPIMPGAAPRTFLAKWFRRQDFKSSLGDGKSGSIEYGCRQRAEVHLVTPTIEVNVSSALGPLDLRVLSELELEHDPRELRPGPNGGQYRNYLFKFQQARPVREQPVDLTVPLQLALNAAPQ